MKKNIFILITLAALVLVISVLYFFWPVDNDHTQQTVAPVDTAATTMTPQSNSGR